MLEQTKKSFEAGQTSAVAEEPTRQPYLQHRNGREPLGNGWGPTHPQDQPCRIPLILNTAGQLEKKGG